MLTKPTMETQQRKSVLRVWLAREDREYQRALDAAGIPKPALLRIAGEMFEQRLRETALTLVTDRIDAPDAPKTLLAKADFASLCEDLWTRLRVMNVETSPEMRRGLDFAVESVIRRTLPHADSAPTLLQAYELLTDKFGLGKGPLSEISQISDDVRDAVIRFIELPSAFFSRFMDEADAAIKASMVSAPPDGLAPSAIQKDALRAHLHAEMRRIWKTD